MDDRTLANRPLGAVPSLADDGCRVVRRDRFARPRKASQFLGTIQRYVGTRKGSPPGSVTPSASSRAAVGQRRHGIGLCGRPAKLGWRRLGKLLLCAALF